MELNALASSGAGNSPYPKAKPAPISIQTNNNINQPRYPGTRCPLPNRLVTQEVRSHRKRARIGEEAGGPTCESVTRGKSEIIKKK